MVINHILLAEALPAHYPMVYRGSRVGHVLQTHWRHLSRFPQAFTLDQGEIRIHPQLGCQQQLETAFSQINADLHQTGCWTGWRDELLDVKDEQGHVLWRIERSAARFFGVQTRAVHLNAWVRTAGVDAMWVARRSLSKAIDPGLWDNLVAGGMAAGESPAETLRRECWEEAGIGAHLADRAHETAQITVLRGVPEGIQHEVLVVFEITLPPDFKPCNQDGEVIDHRLIARAALHLALNNPQAPFTEDAALVIRSGLDLQGG